MNALDTVGNRARLTAEDLVPDEPLRGSGKNPIAASQDLLHHRVIARKVAELATSANGKVNIALFGPWGAGKSSFNELLREELQVIDPKARHITFDAWKNAGEGFRTNFLSELARQIPKADRKISDQLFQATTRVTLPFTKRDLGGRVLLLIGASVLLGLFILLPLLWTGLGSLFTPTDNFLERWFQNVGAWSGVAVSSTLLLVVIAGLLELSKVTVSKSMPSHVAQFSTLFDKLLATDAKSRYIIFIDELDRCGKKDVMATLEGLRTFLGHERCVFVVAFDRDAIATTIAEEMRHSVPTQAVAPYYRTSGEYLDKIFQFQIALPPQPTHTFRRYALSLVKDRGGVWAQLRARQDGLLDRVIPVLSPMHLASPRRTKVLLNDFAVNARVFESLGFDWLNRAEEIAVLTVIQTEFPNLMADIERAPSLMRVLYRGDTPTRPEVQELLDRYRESVTGGAESEVELDRVVQKSGDNHVARDLQVNLRRYLRRLREMGAPEPRADLIMMHSDGNLLHFDNPDVYHEVLLAADTPREDVVEALSHASPRDRALAIDHILEQAEPESVPIARSLRVLAGELAAGLPIISPATASNLRSGMFAGFAGHTQTSMEGYARAVAVSYTQETSAQVMAAAAEHSNDALGAVISRFVDDFTPEDWQAMQPLIMSRVVENAAELPGATAAVLRRTGEDATTGLTSNQVSVLARSLSSREPDEVEPAANTAAARSQAEEENARRLEEFEQQREGSRGATRAIFEIWPQLPAMGGLRGDLLRVLRAAQDESEWHLDQHDQLIVNEIGVGEIDAANAHLLSAIIDEPRAAAARWRNLLSDDAPVDAEQKAKALDVVVNRATSSEDVSVRANGADNALRLASLPSEPITGAGLLEKVAGIVGAVWDEYTDDRFEYISTLLDAIDLLGDVEAQTSPYRARLYVDAVASAQAEEASIEQIVRSARSLNPTAAAAVAGSLADARLWEQEYPEASIRVLLAVQLVAIPSGEAVVPLPAVAITQLSDSIIKKQVADMWLETAPPTTELKAAMATVSFAATAWQRFGERVAEGRRADAWGLLTQHNSTAASLRAVSLAGQPLEVYEEAAANVRDASTIKLREQAMDQFLSLPVETKAAGVAQALVKAMAAEKKRTEIPLGFRLIKAYHPQWSKGTISGIRQHFTPWAEAGESHLGQSKMSWLAQEGYITRKSTIFQQLFGRKT